MSVYSSGSPSSEYVTEVILNVYDLSPPSFQVNLLKQIGIGFYHTGVEINGVEYSYGGNFSHSGTGVFSSSPLQVDGAIYKESFLMGTVKDQRKLHQVLDLVKDQFKANQYDLIQQNCNHFSEALCLQLLNKRLPSYINRASRIGYYSSCFLPKMIKNSNPVPQEGGSQKRDTETSNNGYDYSSQPQNIPFTLDTDTTIDSARVAFTGKGYRISDYETDNL